MNLRMMVVAIALMIAGTSAAQEANQNIIDPEKVAPILNRIGQDTVCMVNSSFFIRDMSIFGAQVAGRNRGANPAEFQKQVIDPIYEAIKSFDEDRTERIAELVDMGIEREYARATIQRIVFHETDVNMRAWANVTNLESGMAYVTGIVRKLAVCSEYLKSLKSQKL